MLDAPNPMPAESVTALLLNVVLRSLLALLLGLGIAFVLHYLDQTVRRVAEVEALGLNVLGAIPLEQRT